MIVQFLVNVNPEVLAHAQAHHLVVENLLTLLAIAPIFVQGVDFVDLVTITNHQVLLTVSDANQTTHVIINT